ncbi:DUF6152 family protein [Methylobrevis pamukkalensis]|uniref:DUF5666 domain-containing protein n=1 Tax=Methylobrevis pamukkalensis TaxID=1439726 RepID=A0A1E3H5P7_9HYPH|nr:DUF6152 family protein [Methylobrevis pamukkalensis]ODN71475.1 hypothetical protein A6302_01164 [Methylobrevis pamukkalensis]
MRQTTRRGILALGGALVASGGLAGAAFAHHGWSWTEDGFFQLEGVVREVYVGNPHATLDVDVEGTIWRVELAPPYATRAAGFTEDSAAPGEEVTAIGNRSREDTEPRMKAVRLIVRGTTYDVYPRRTDGL